MCDSTHAWVTDKSVEGPHDQIPVKCSDYIAALEQELVILGADKIRLDDLQMYCAKARQL